MCHTLSKHVVLREPSLPSLPAITCRKTIFTVLVNNLVCVVTWRRAYIGYAAVLSRLFVLHFLALGAITPPPPPHQTKEGKQIISVVFKTRSSKLINGVHLGERVVKRIRTVIANHARCKLVLPHHDSTWRRMIRHVRKDHVTSHHYGVVVIQESCLNLWI